MWVLTPALSAVPGWPAEAALGSAITHLVQDVAPTPPETMQALRRFVQDGTFPAVFNELRRSPDPGPPPIEGLPAAVHQRVVQSTVKVSGEACRRIQEGSGFAAMPDMIVTNAHVVAGEKAPRVETFQGKNLPATVVLFDTNRDLALLRVPGLSEQPLPVAKAKEGDTGAVYGHPGGGDLRAAPVLASALRPGDSGAALIDKAGDVVGVAFAIAPDKPGVSYALTDKELRPVLAAAGTSAVSTGACLDT